MKGLELNLMTLFIDPARKKTAKFFSLKSKQT